MALTFTKIEPERRQVLEKWLAELRGEMSPEAEALERDGAEAIEESAKRAVPATRIRRRHRFRFLPGRRHPGKERIRWRGSGGHVSGSAFDRGPRLRELDSSESYVLCQTRIFVVRNENLIEFREHRLVEIRRRGAPIPAGDTEHRSRSIDCHFGLRHIALRRVPNRFVERNAYVSLPAG